jgi:hypothetical protein
VVREKLEAEGGDGNCERLCSLSINAVISLIPVFKIFLVFLTFFFYFYFFYIFKSFSFSVC